MQTDASLSREWLKELPREDRRIIGEDIKDVEFAWPLGLPLVRSLGRSLWEVRSSLTQGRIARIVFCVTGGQMVLLHGFNTGNRSGFETDEGGRR